MPYQTKGLVDKLKRFGLKVELVPGWETRGSASFNPKGVVAHHTAGPAGGIRPSLSVVTKGRPNLNGPLCNFYLDRNGVVVVVAAGRANHAGAGGYRGLVGNSSVWGIEAESTGILPAPWTDAQLDAYPRLIAAILSYSGRDATWVTNHKIWAPTRKVDCVSLSNEWFQDRVRQILKEGGDDMFSDEDRKLLQEVREQLAGEGGTKSGVWPGWLSWVDQKTRLTTLDFIRAVDLNVNAVNKKLDDVLARIAKLEQK